MDTVSFSGENDCKWQVAMKIYAKYLMKIVVEKKMSTVFNQLAILKLYTTSNAMQQANVNWIYALTCVVPRWHV